MASRALRSGRPGPRDPGYSQATYDETADPYHPVKGWKSAPDPADVRAAVDQLLRAGNPLIYAGEGVAERRLWVQKGDLRWNARQRVRCNFCAGATDTLPKY